MGTATEAGRLRRGLHLVSATVRAFSASTHDYAELLEAIARHISHAIPGACIVTLRSEDGLTMTPVAVHDDDAGVRARLVAQIGPYPIAEAPLAESVMRDGTLFAPAYGSYVIGRSSAAGSRLFRELGTHSLLVVAMGQHGVITLARHTPDGPFDELDREILEDLAGHAALAIDNARLVARLAASEALRLAEERAGRVLRIVDAILENIPAMVFVKDAADLAFVRFNRAGELLLGTTRDQIIGKTDFDLFPRADAEQFVARDREALRGDRMVDIPEEPVQTATGVRWLHTRKVPLLDAAGNPEYLLGVSYDITDRKHLDAELEAFTYSVAHDLRAPLRGVLGYATAVLEDESARLSDDGSRHLARVVESGERMARLIDDLVSLARVSRAELHRGRADLSALAHSSLAGLHARSPERTLETVIAPGLVVDGDPYLMAVVVEELIDNAWKFTAQQAPARIELGATEVDGAPAYFVRDNGAGFDMAYADRLFGVFHRLHRESEFSGTGIGLATVARIVRRHGGRVWATGAPGEGATFYFTMGPTARVG